MIAFTGPCVVQTQKNFHIISLVKFRSSRTNFADDGTFGSPPSRYYFRIGISIYISG